IDHTAPGIAAALEHFAHEAKGDAADLREEEIGGVLFIVEVFAEPQPVEIGKMFHVQIGAAHESIPGVVLVGAVEVDDARMTVLGEHAFDALHGNPVEGDVVEVNTVDPDVVYEPVHAFYIVVMPAAHAAVDNGSIFNFGYEPGRDIVIAEMFL